MSVERLQVDRTIPAEAAAIFQVLCDPNGHVAIDSSGMLMDATGDPVNGVGDSFVVHMDREALNDFPLGRYDVTVTITTYEQDREIAWGILGLIRPPIGHVYGYTLEPADTGTLVTSYYDWSDIDPVWRERDIFPIIPKAPCAHAGHPRTHRDARRIPDPSLDSRTGVRLRWMRVHRRHDLHADLDAFYAPVEQLLDPSLLGRRSRSVVVWSWQRRTRRSSSGCRVACRDGGPSNCVPTCCSYTGTSPSISGWRTRSWRCSATSPRWCSASRSTRRSSMCPDRCTCSGRPR
jgi:hypothetical protein